MTQPPSSALSSFSAAERELIRREFGMRFGGYASLAEGILLHTWRTGPRKGEPKLPRAVQTMLDRGFVEIRPDRLWARALFTEAGLAALRTMAANPRLLPPDQFAHLRRELGLDGTAE
jgi:hypothetical protein